MGASAHIEVRGIHRPEAHDLRLAVEHALLSQKPVRAVEMLAVLGRVAVAFDEDATTVEDLVAVVEGVEQEQGVALETFPGDRPEHPGDAEQWRRDLLALGADVAALAFVGVGRAARLARAPTEVAGLLAFAQSQTWVRRRLESVLGRGPADIALAMSGATTQALAQGTLALIVDGGHRLSLSLESRARMESWRAREAALVPGRPRPEVHDRPARPVSLPAGPVERYERQALVASGAAFATAGLATRSLRRGAAALVATTPKAAALGRDAFAAHLGRVLAERGVITLDRGALRRLDRVDAVVLDAPALPRPTADIERIIPLAGFEPGQVAGRVRTLFRPERARAVRGGGGARLEPLSDSDVTPEVRQARHDLGGRGDLLLLCLAGIPAAVALVGPAIPPETDLLVRATRQAGHMLAVAGDQDLSRRLGADLYLEGGDRLTGSMGMLQRDGCVSLLVSRRSRALAAADVGVGLVSRDGVIPWGADVLVSDWEAARFLIEASAVAHEVSRQSAAVSLAGSSFGALSLLGGRSATATSRAMTSVNAAALLALANGTRAAVGLARRPRPQLRASAPWHELSPDDTLARTRSSRAGLSTAEVLERARPSRSQAAGPSFARALGAELANPLTPVLAGASVLAASVGSLTDAALVAGVTGVNATIGAVQRLQVERAIGALSGQGQQRVRVRRDGEIRVVAPSELVVGDLVLLDAGSQVPADCRLLTATALEADESALTGESLPVAKAIEPVIAASPADRTSMLYEATSIAAGAAEAIVVAVGADTEAGQAAAGDSVSTGGVESRLQDLTRVSLPASALGGAGVMVAGLLRGLPIASVAQTGVGLAVAAVPEGLPALATVAQLAAARRLSRRGALVRNVRAIEALGRVEVLCTDKTGTMTEGHIELSLVSDGEHAVPVTAAGRTQSAIVAAAVAASPRERPGRPIRHLTDRAVVDAAPAWGVELGDGHRHQDLPFEPGRGYHAVVERHGDGLVLYVKGAPDRLLPRCRTWHSGQGEVIIDRRRRSALESHVQELAGRGLRVLLVAKRPATGTHDLADDRVKDLVLLGFLALADPVRATAADAARALRDAGVRIVMVTGDHPSTAQGVAEELGIFEPGTALTGLELDQLGDFALEAALDRVTVFARVTPAHKVRIVEAYRRRGQAVAMAGDGANDAAAIRLADAGVALGQNTTSAARGGADIVVADGRVETLLDAVVEGRAMWSSVRDAVAILLGGNLGEVGFVLTAAALTGRSPLSARQLLLVNLLTDTLPALAVALRAPEAGSTEVLLREGPEASLGQSLERTIYVRGGVTAASATAAWIAARLTAQGVRTPTVSLVGLVGAQLGQTLAVAGRDPRVLAASLGSAAAMGAIISTPGLSQVFGCQPLGPVGWSIGLGAAGLGTCATFVARHFEHQP